MDQQQLMIICLDNCVIQMIQNDDDDVDQERKRRGVLKGWETIGQF